MLAATDAALSSRAAAGWGHTAAGAGAGPGASGDGGSAAGPELDLHGLSAAEARAAVLTRLATLQVCLHRVPSWLPGLTLPPGQQPAGRPHSRLLAEVAPSHRAPVQPAPIDHS